MANDSHDLTLTAGSVPANGQWYPGEHHPALHLDGDLIWRGPNHHLDPAVAATEARRTATYYLSRLFGGDYDDMGDE